ncbi:MAG: acyl carrier protein [Chitinivibrionales bacterium]
MSEYTGDSAEDIYSRVTRVVAEVLCVEPEEISEGCLIKEDLGADSLDQVTLLMALEDAFDREISDEEAEGLKTVKDTVDFIQGNTPESDAGAA